MTYYIPLFKDAFLKAIMGAPSRSTSTKTISRAPKLTSQSY